MNIKISVIITTLNEEPNIERVLRSVEWADDILVVDSFSTDRTLEIASRFDTRIVQREFTILSEQRNWAIPQAKYEWVLMVDADEEVTPELREELSAFVRQRRDDADAFWIHRRNFFLGKEIRYSGWGKDKVIRFFRRDTCRFLNKQVHEDIDTRGIRVGFLSGKLNHYTLRSMEHFLQKNQKYGEWSARDHMERTPKVTYFHLWVKPCYRFFKHFFLQRGFLDGKVGFIISAIMAWGVFLRYMYLFELYHGKAQKETA